jgi:hypothetical protein
MRAARALLPEILCFSFVSWHRWLDVCIRLVSACMYRVVTWDSPFPPCYISEHKYAYKMAENG